MIPIGNYADSHQWMLRKSKAKRFTSLAEGSAETVFGIIYPPQVALVGIGNIAEQPFAENGMLDVRPVVNIILSADHRATDGQTGSRFLIALKSYLQKPETLCTNRKLNQLLSV